MKTPQSDNHWELGSGCWMGLEQVQEDDQQLEHWRQKSQGRQQRLLTRSQRNLSNAQAQAFPVVAEALTDSEAVVVEDPWVAQKAQPERHLAPGRILLLVQTLLMQAPLRQAAAQQTTPPAGVLKWQAAPPSPPRYRRPDSLGWVVWPCHALVRTSSPTPV